MAESVGDRIALIRLACGGGKLKDAITQKALAALMNDVPGSPGNYTGNKVSQMETETREVSLLDAKILAAVDPLQRGINWLALGDETPPALPPGVKRAPPATPAREFAEKAKAAAKGATKRRA